MDVKKISELVSRASWSESTLLFCSPEEVRRDIEEGRVVVLEEEGELVGFCRWQYFGGWLELSTVYVVPKFRGRGCLSKLLELARERLASIVRTPNIFLFTQVPLMKKLVSERYGFQPKKYSELPPRVWLSLLSHCLHPRRILSYAKFFKGLRAMGAWQLFILQQEA